MSHQQAGRLASSHVPGPPAGPLLARWGGGPGPISSYRGRASAPASYDGHPERVRRGGRRGIPPPPSPPSKSRSPPTPVLRRVPQSFALFAKGGKIYFLPPVHSAFTPLGPPRPYFAVHCRSGIMRPATVPREQDKGTLVAQEDAPPAIEPGSFRDRVIEARSAFGPPANLIREMDPSVCAMPGASGSTGGQSRMEKRQSGD